MTFGYVEELTLRYFEKKDYLVFPNIRFQLKKERTKKTVAGWSDIDMIALSQDEMIIVQCKSFLGTDKAERVAQNIMEWFGNAKHFLEGDKTWKDWCKGRTIKQYLVVDGTIKKVETLLKSQNINIEIFYYETLLIELLNMLKSGKARKGKEDDVIIRLLCAMIDSDLVK